MLKLSSIRVISLLNSKEEVEKIRRSTELISYFHIQ